MNKYRVIKDLQGGSFGSGRDYTAEEWLDEMISWKDADDYYETDEDRQDEIDHWYKEIRAGREELLIDYIAEVWQLKFEKIA